MNLYDIPNEIMALLLQADPETGELPLDLNAQLDALVMAFDKKAESICMVIRQKQAEAKAFKAEADLFSQKAKAAANAADRVQAYLFEQMERLKKNEAGGAMLMAKIQKSAPSLRVLDKKAVLLEAKHELFLSTIKYDGALTESIPLVEKNGEGKEFVMWAHDKSPWKIILELSATRCKELNETPEGCEFQPGKYLKITPGYGGAK